MLGFVTWLPRLTSSVWCRVSSRVSEVRISWHEIIGYNVTLCYLFSCLLFLISRVRIFQKRLEGEIEKNRKSELFCSLHLQDLRTNILQIEENDVNEEVQRHKKEGGLTHWLRESKFPEYYKEIARILPFEILRS